MVDLRISLISDSTKNSMVIVLDGIPFGNISEWEDVTEAEVRDAIANAATSRRGKLEYIHFPRRSDGYLSWELIIFSGLSAIIDDVKEDLCSVIARSIPKELKEYLR